MFKKTFAKNSITALILEIIVFIFGFFVPKLIIEVYNPEIHGLSANILQVLSIIQLIQAGSIGASIYALYKPIGEKNESEIIKIYNASSRFFNKTSIIYLIISIVVALFSPIFIKVTTITSIEVILSFLVFVVLGFIQFYYISKYDVILSAHQKRYILTTGNIIEKLTYYSILFIVILTNQYFILMYVAMLVGILVKTFYLNRIIHKEYGEIIRNKEFINDHSTIPNRSNVMISSIIMNLVNAIPILVISYYWGLEFVSVFGIYNMVAGVILMLLNVIAYSSVDILGIGVSNSTREKIIDLFDNINIMYYCVLFIVIFPSYVLITPFVEIYVSNSTDLNYLYPVLGYLVVINLSCFMLFLITRSILQSFGLFKIQKNALLISFISVLPIYIITANYNFSLIILGTIIFYLLYCVVSLTILIINKFNYLHLFVKPILIFVTSALVMIGAGNLLSAYININDLYSWIVNGIILVFGSFLMFTISMVFFYKKKVIQFIGFVKNKIKSIFKGD